MRAPSEKHLEDWIVANPQRVLPDYFWWEDKTYPLIDKVVTRQPRFPVGIPDLIVKTMGGVAVIEIKKGEIDDSTMIQCLRYMAFLEHVSMTAHYRLTNEIASEDWKYLDCGFREGMITGFMIGHSIKTNNLLYACELLEIYPILYDYDQAADTYSFRMGPYIKSDPASESADWARGAIGDAMRDTMLARAGRLKARDARDKAQSGGGS